MSSCQLWAQPFTLCSGGQHLLWWPQHGRMGNAQTNSPTVISFQPHKGPRGDEASKCACRYNPPRHISKILISYQKIEEIFKSFFVVTLSLKWLQFVLLNIQTFRHNPPCSFAWHLYLVTGSANRFPRGVCKAVLTRSTFSSLLRATPGPPYS